MTQPAKLAPHTQHVKHALQLQLVLVTLFTLIAVFFFGVNAGRSWFLGAMIAWIGQAVFAWQTFRFAGARAHTLILRGMYRGQLAKWLVNIIGFVLVFSVYKPDNALLVLLGFWTMLLTNWGYVLLGKQKLK